PASVIPTSSMRVTLLKEVRSTWTGTAGVPTPVTGTVAVRTPASKTFTFATGPTFSTATALNGGNPTGPGTTTYVPSSPSCNPPLGAVSITWGCELRAASATVTLS